MHCAVLVGTWLCRQTIDRLFQERDVDCCHDLNLVPVSYPKLWNAVTFDDLTRDLRSVTRKTSKYTKVGTRFQPLQYLHLSCCTCASQSSGRSRP